MNIAIIPARGGSKRIPRKNIKDFCGLPMIAYAINLAKEAKLFEHIVVSTDDHEIAALAKSFGAETPFMRSDSLSDDHTPTVPVILEGIRICQEMGWSIQNVCCIYPCVPLMQSVDLTNSLSRLIQSDVGYCFPIAEYPAAPQRALRWLQNGRTEPVQEQYEMVRTQELEKRYFDAGQFYWGRLNAWLSNLNIHSNAIGFAIPSWRAIDIDNEADWQRAELIYQLIKQQKE